MYDVVVIGAGIGGLTTAALLARDGYRVLVLEGHIEPGGCASSYERRRPDGSRYLFDVGATLFAGFRPGGAHHWVGQRLGIVWPVRPLEPAMEVWLPDERVTRWGDERWGDERRRAFHQSLPASESFWRAQERTAEIAWRFAARMPPLPVESPGDLLGLAASTRPELALILPGMLRTVARELQRHSVTDRRLRAYIDGQLLISAQTGADRCAWLYGAVALDFARIGAHYAEGGAIALARTLVGALLRDGGEIRYRSWVTRILTEGRQAIGVEVTGGERIAARAVVANTTYADAGRLLGNPPAPAEQLPQGWGAFMLYLGIDQAAVPPGAAEHHQVIASYDLPLGEANSAFISIHPPDDARRAPAGQRAVTISTHTEVSRWWRLRGDRNRYRNEKADMAERLLATASIALPQIGSSIRYQQAATPISFQRYTRRELGMVGGLPQTLLRSGFFSRGPRSTGVRNLLLVGDSVFPGQSTAAVTQSGIRAYRLLRGGSIR